MKILVAGDFHSQIHEKAFYDAFLALGHKVEKFAWSEYFGGYLLNRPKGIFDYLPFLYYRFQNKFIIGPIINRINRDLVRKIEENKYDFVFIYRGTHIFPETISYMRSLGSMVFGYNNDDPFGHDYTRYFWRHFIESVPFYNHIFVYRDKNIVDYSQLGYTQTSLLRSYFISSKNFIIQDIETSRYTSDISFVGHYENDGRDDFLKTILDLGINLKLFGPEWDQSKHYKFFVRKCGFIKSATGLDYNLALNSTKIALVFLSKLNNDTYTRRCFEIPAAGTFMLATYTDDLNNLFREGIEADYFRNQNEMVKKIKYYLSHDEERKKIAVAGRNRLLREGHEIKDRARQIIDTFVSLKR